MINTPSDSDKAAENERRLKLYNQAVGESRLAKLVLAGVDYKVDHVIYKGSDDPALNYSGELIEFDHSKEHGAVFAVVKWSAEVKRGRKRALKCVATYNIIYDGFKVDDRDILERFADNVARPASYTYFRSLFATLDWASDLRTKPLPVAKFFPRI